MNHIELGSASHKPPSKFIQFYKEKLPQPRRPCIEKWSISIEKQLYFAEWIFTACYKIPGNINLTGFKVLMSIIATVVLILEYYNGEKIMRVYILVNIIIILFYLLSIIILNIARYVGTRRINMEMESKFNLISTAWYYLNAFALILSYDSILIIIILVGDNNIWNYLYYIYFTCIGLILVTDSLGLFILSLPIMIGIMLECGAYYLTQFITCGRCLGEPMILIPGVNCAPNLYLKEHEHEVIEANANKDYNDCPICLCALKEGHYVVFMPCGEAHIFHRHCITTWMKNHGECPTCRAEFQYQDDISILSDPSMTIVNSEEISADIPDVVAEYSLDEGRVTNRALNIRDHSSFVQTEVMGPKNLKLGVGARDLHTTSSGDHQMIYGQLFLSLPAPECIYIYIYIYILN